MPARDVAALPPSHVFVTLAHRTSQRTIVLSRGTAGLLGAALALIAVWTVLATIYVAGHDSLLAGLMRRERDAQYDYEDRIASLQRQLERATSQRSMLERTVGTRLDALTAQEADLRRNAETVATLARQVVHAAGATAPSAKAADATSTVTRPGDRPARIGDRLADLTERFDTVATSQAEQLTTLKTTADREVSRYTTALAEAGLTAARFVGKREASGGPFVPIEAVRSPFDRASLSLKATLAEAERLHGVATRVPFAKPLEGSPEVTSPFGARVDPFLGRPALHTGIDLREDTGTAVMATAAGRVSFAGPASGYGLMVEVDHGSGLATRYAHLSATEVSVGDVIGAGALVGRVGATGRATGPHLHYETRIDGEPVDPMRFLAAGRQLLAATTVP